eukprot:SAG31_NODE_287_length_18430_cov_8.127544_5_plen_105_part_00
MYAACTAGRTPAVPRPPAYRGATLDRTRTKFSINNTAVVGVAAPAGRAGGLRAAAARPGENSEYTAVPKWHGRVRTRGTTGTKFFDRYEFLLIIRLGWTYPRTY